MAQKTGKEETDFKVVPPPAETIAFSASSSTSAPASTSTTSPASSSASSKHLTFRSEKSSPERKLSSSETAKRDRTESPSEITPPPAKRSVNRCSGCRRKVGLTGFRCRCGDLFCSEHRYSDRHDCGYDYKAAGREAIARENPVVKASKIVKI